MGDPVGKDPGLSGTGPGNHHKRSILMKDGRFLGLIELIQKHSTTLAFGAVNLAIIPRNLKSLSLGIINKTLYL